MSDFKCSNCGQIQDTEYWSERFIHDGDEHVVCCNNCDEEMIARVSIMVAYENISAIDSINEATKGHRAKHDALAAVNADDGVWLPHGYVDNLLSALTTNSNALNALAQLVDIEGSEEADKINDYSMEVLDIAMSLTLATTNVRPNPNSACISGTWLAHDYLKQVKQSIDGNANGLGTMAILASLTDAGMNEGVSEASMRLAEISESIGELIINGQ